MAEKLAAPGAFGKISLSDGLKDKPMAIQGAASEALSVPASTLSAVPFRVRLLAESLTLHRSSQDAGRLYQPLNQSVIDLNPHQIDAAIFAFNSPLSRGAILADEVGLGKTIEAGLVISQLVAEGQRHVLVLCPATLRAQWVSELQEKFGLTATIIRNGTGLSQLPQLCVKAAICEGSSSRGELAHLQIRTIAIAGAADVAQLSVEAVPQGRNNTYKFVPCHTYSPTVMFVAQMPPTGYFVPQPFVDGRRTIFTHF